MKGYIIILGVVCVAVYASAVGPESVNAPQPGTASEPGEQPYYREDRHSDGTFTRTGIFSNDLLYHDHFQFNGAIIRTYTFRPTGITTPQVMASSSIIDEVEEQRRAGLLSTGFIQEPNGVWWKHHPGKVYSYENRGGTRTPRGLWYKIFNINTDGKLTTTFLADGLDETTYYGILVPGTTSLDEDILFTLMGYSGTPSGIWYKRHFPREVSGEWVNECIVVGPDSSVYTGNLPFSITSPDEATLFEKIMGYTKTPSGIWYKIVPPRHILDKWVNVCTVFGPDGRVYKGKLPVFNTSPDEATLFKIMGYTETPRGIRYKIVLSEGLDEWVNECTVIGPDGGVYTGILPHGTTSPDEATLFKIMGYTGTPSGIWYKIVPPRRILDKWVSVCIVFGPEGGAYTGTLPLGTTSPDEATLLKIMGMTGTPSGI